MRDTVCIRAIPAALFLLVGLLMSGCTLLYSSSVDVDGDEEEVEETASCSEEVCTVALTIGGAGRDFQTIGAWEEARRGDLTQRALIDVSGNEGRFERGETVSGAGSGCGGTYRAADEAGTNGGFLSLDDYEGECQSGEELVGDRSGARATFRRILGRGTVERGILHSDQVFSENVVFDGSTTDEKHFMWLAPSPADSHGGRADDGVVLEPSVSGHAIAIYDDYVRISGLEIRGWSDESDSYDAIHIAADGVIIERALIHHEGSTPQANGIMVDASEVQATVRNTVVHDVGGAGVAIYGHSDVQLQVLNCTVVRCSLSDASAPCVGARDGIRHEISAINNIAASCTACFDSGANSGWSSDSGFNISSDESAPGDQAMTLADPAQLFESADPPRDLHLAPSSAAEGSGRNLSHQFDDDIDGDRRPVGAWDIGADER